MYLEFRKHFNACVKGYDSGYQKKGIIRQKPKAVLRGTFTALT